MIEAMMDGLGGQLERVRQRIREAEHVALRPSGSVRLLAVSKTHAADRVRAAHSHGQREFGENYLQEALVKQAQLVDLDLVWHFIGPLQSNKSRLIAEHFQWVHSVDRLKIAERLNAQRPGRLPPLQVCLQVNVSGEASKSGCAPGDLPALAAAVARLPRLRLRGLMAIPAPSRDPGEQRAAFRRLRLLLESLDNPALDTLSMGMSDDLEAAVLEGSTLVRIGTAVFGARGG